MTPQDAQWLLLGSYAALLAWALFVGYRMARLRPLCFAVGTVALTHCAYYAAFLVWPDWLDGPQTQMFSIAIRFQVMVTLGAVLALATRRGRWR
jgi:ABC-type branched-subunit amino acid transport system permease subunit